MRSQHRFWPRRSSRSPAAMAVSKVPRVVQFVEAPPKSGSGKVMWRALQEAEQAGGEGMASNVRCLRL